MFKAHIRLTQAIITWHPQVRAALDRGSVSWSEAQWAGLVKRAVPLAEVKDALVDPGYEGRFITITGAACSSLQAVALATNYKIIDYRL